MEARGGISPWSGRDTLALIGLMGMALAVRVPHLISPYVINPDAIHYIASAKALAQGKWIEGFRISHASLFPFLLAFVQPLAKDWVLAARGITVFFGFLTVLPLYLVARSLLPLQWAIIPPLFYCLSPSLTHYSVDVIREPLSWFLLLTALWALLRAEKSFSWAWFILAGAILMLGAANRLDGLLALAVASLWISGKELIGGRLVRAVKGAAVLLLPCLVATLAAAIFFTGTINKHDPLELRTYQRQIQLALRGSDQAQKQSIENILESIPQPRLRSFFSSAWDNRRILAAWDLLRHWVKAAHPALLLLSLIGLFAWRRWKDNDHWWLIALLLVAWLILGYVRLSGAFAISRRHLGPMVLSGYLFAALGFLQVAPWVAQRGFPRLSRAAPWVLLCLLGLLTLPWTLHPQRAEKLVRRLAGEWINQQGISAPVVATDHQIVAFYATGVWLPLKELWLDFQGEVDFLVLEENAYYKSKVMEALEKRDLMAVEVKRVEHSHDSLLIYRITPRRSTGIGGSIGGGKGISIPQRAPGQ